MIDIVRSLDFDELKVVEDVCETYEEFVNWNKGYFIYEIFDPKVPLDAIYIAHNLWDRGELSTAEEFFEDLNEVLNDYIEMYPDNKEEQMNDIMQFFNKFK